jgi:hypothetical protein
LKVRAFPDPSTATQNDCDGQETDLNPKLLLGSTCAGALQELPLNVSACPLEPTAAQNDAEAHDTDTSPPPSAKCGGDRPGIPGTTSTQLGALQELPLKVRALPFSSTAAQNDVDGQETDVTPPTIAVGPVQVLPLNV